MATVDPTDLQGLERERIEREERDRLAARLESEDLKWWLSNKRGRRIAWRLLDRAGVFRSSFNTVALTMAFNEGQRNEGLRLLAAILDHCPDRYLELTAENRKRDNRNPDDGSDANS